MGTIIYLLQVSACIGIFYGFYYFMLRRLTFFTINRWYLIGTLVLSFAVPLLTITVRQQHVAVIERAIYINQLQNRSLQANPPQLVKNVQPTTISKQVAEPFTINWLQILKLAYIAAVIALFVRLIMVLAAFFANIKGKKITQIGNVHILRGNKDVSNGSFLNYIFLNDDVLSADEIQQILAHEMLHVKLLHSVDRIVVKLMQIVLWFNPFIYLYARAIEENHEFEVDREIGRSNDKSRYADMLLHLSIAGHGTLYHNFSKVPLKRRITMLFTKPTNHMKKIIYLLILPVVMISCLAFARLKTEVKKNTITDVGKLNPPKKVSAATNAGKHQEKTNLEPVQKTQSAPLTALAFNTNTTAVNINADKKTDTVSRQMDWYQIITPGLIVVVDPGVPFFSRTLKKNDNGSDYDKVTFYPIEGRATVNLSPNEKFGAIINGVFYKEEYLKKLKLDKAIRLIVRASKVDKYKTPEGEYYVPFTFVNRPVSFYNLDTVKTANIKMLTSYGRGGVMTPKESKSIIDAAEKSNRPLFDRFAIHPNDNRHYDVVLIKIKNGYTVATTLRYKNKFGAMIDGKFYDEEAFKRLSNKTFASLSIDNTTVMEVPEGYSIPFSFTTK